jgi:hypothetical protein
VSVDDMVFAGVSIFNCVCGILNAYFAQRNFESARANAELARSLTDTAAKFGYVVLAKGR